VNNTSKSEYENVHFQTTFQQLIIKTPWSVYRIN